MPDPVSRKLTYMSKAPSADSCLSQGDLFKLQMHSLLRSIAGVSESCGGYQLLRQDEDHRRRWKNGMDEGKRHADKTDLDDKWASQWLNLPLRASEARRTRHPCNPCLSRYFLGSSRISVDLSGRREVWRGSSKKNTLNGLAFLSMTRRVEANNQRRKT